jgi:hypothetical protein
MQREDRLRNWRRGVAIVAVLGLLAGAAMFIFRGPDIPADSLKALINAERYELLSLDPERSETPPVDAFRGWRVLGRTVIDDVATRKGLCAALRSGAREKDVSPAACFEPRHGIRVTRSGTTTDFVICFACSQVQVFEGDQKKHGFLVSGAPQSTFDEVLRAKSVPLAVH